MASNDDLLLGDLVRTCEGNVAIVLKRAATYDGYSVELVERPLKGRAWCAWIPRASLELMKRGALYEYLSRENGGE